MAPPKRTPPSGAQPEGPHSAPGPRAQTSMRAAGATLPDQSRGPKTLPERLRASRDRVYESVMRGGGEPFGEPFTFGLSSLTSWAAGKLKQRGFFGFETLERPDPAARLHGNKFTRYGAAPFRGEHANKRKPR